MESSNGHEEHLADRLATLGIEHDGPELAVMRAADRVFAPAVAALLGADLSATAPERGIDLSREPRGVDG